MIGRPLICLDSVTSTQDVAFRLAERGAVEGTTVIARHQTSGRGRAGRTWETSPGDALLFSVVLRPRPRIPADLLTLLSILVADAIADTLTTLYDLSPSIKWPNDVLLDGRKVSGILIQMRAGIMVIGVGINLHTPPSGMPGRATSICEETGNTPEPELVFREVLIGIERRYHALVEEDVAEILAGINGRLWLRGHDVTIQDADREIVGVVRDVRPNGALLLDTQDGPKTIVSGEMVRGPRAMLP